MGFLGQLRVKQYPVYLKLLTFLTQSINYQEGRAVGKAKFDKKIFVKKVGIFPL